MSIDRGALAAGLSGVYLLTPDVNRESRARMVAALRRALRAGVRAVQYRNKLASPDGRHKELAELRALTRAHQALLIVNDDVDLAIEFSADGVHLGRDDGDLALARRRLPHALLGASCYDDLERARRAVEAGADVLAFGSVFASQTKPAAVRAPLALLGEARRQFPQQRIVAIGGIDHSNIARVAAAGAHAAALISAVFDAPDPADAATGLQQEFERGRLSHVTQRAAV
ncbi:MAG TPA: thiamine phosphate synthase [Burkholderiaceae bacterium]|nr:thiamine phosphate synthase [Burkholderiaceae bacterium]